MTEFALGVMPQLRSGVGGSPKDGGCVIQVVSYLWNREWSDATPCVHPALRAAAIRVNDAVSDGDRQRMWPLVPRLMGTAIEDEAENKRVSVGLAIWCAERVFELVRDQDREVCRKAIDAAKAWLAEPSAYAAYAATAYAAIAATAAIADAAYAAYAAATAATDAAYAAYAATDNVRWDRIDLLTGLLDEYDRLTSRPAAADVSEAEWRAVCDVMVGASA